MGHDAFVNFDVDGVLRLVRGAGVDEKAEIGGIRDEATLAGFECVGEAFTGEDFFFQDAEAASVEGERTGVLQPECAQGTTGAVGGIPERDLFGFDVGLKDGDERGLVFAQGDMVLEFVLEEVAEVLAVGGSGGGSIGGVERGRRGWWRRRRRRRAAAQTAARTATDATAFASNRGREDLVGAIGDRELETISAEIVEDSVRQYSTPCGGGDFDRWTDRTDRNWPFK